MAATPDPRQRAWARFVTAQAMLLEQIEAAFAEADLPPLAWYDVLWILENTQEGEQRGWLRMHDLARKAVVSRSNVTRLVDRMEKDGLVERSDCPLDGRGTVCELTARGRALRAKMWPVYRKQVDLLFGKHLDTREANLICTAFDRIIDSSNQRTST